MSDLEVAEHKFLGGRLILREPKRGHRSGTDAILLAAAAGLHPGQHLIDVGAGAGAAALSALSLTSDATATLIEQSGEMAELARRNIVVNGFDSRAHVVHADIFDLEACQALVQRRGDVVISNPPFYLERSVRASPNQQQAASHVLKGQDHGAWMRRVLAFAGDHGRAVVIHRPEALADLLGAAKARAGVSLMAVHPRLDSKATRILVTATMGRRSPLGIVPPLVLHENSGAFTKLADDLHRGSATLT